LAIKKKCQQCAGIGTQQKSRNIIIQTGQGRWQKGDKVGEWGDSRGVTEQL